MRRVGCPASADLDGDYHSVGRLLADWIRGALPANWFDEPRRILDFGSGAGRVMRHFRAEAERGAVWGTDVDTEAVEWMAANLCPPFRTLPPPADAHLDLPDGTLDLVYAISVFTHITDDWAAWLVELDRVLAPGGYLYATYLGPGMISQLLSEPWFEDHTGMNVLRQGQDWEAGGPIVFHSQWWLRTHWGRLFDVIDIYESTLPDGRPLPGAQATILLRKPSIGRSVTAAELERIDPDDPREQLALIHTIGQLHREDAKVRAQLAWATGHIATLEHLLQEAQHRLHEVESDFARQWYEQSFRDWASRRAHATIGPVLWRLRSRRSPVEQLDSDERAAEAVFAPPTPSVAQPTASSQVPPGHYTERGWRDIELPQNVRAVPSMLSYDERKLLLYLSRAVFHGRGSIVDAGAFVGGSSLALAEGLGLNPLRGAETVHSFDTFVLDDYMVATQFNNGVTRVPDAGESGRPYFDHHVAPVASLITLHEGDITATAATFDRDIEILFLDVMKSWTTSDALLTTFFPRLLPGAIVVQQDYVHEAHPWIPIVMEALREQLTFMEFVEFSSAVYRVERPPSLPEVEALTSRVLDAASQRLLMDRAVERLQGYQRGVLECARAQLEAALGQPDAAFGMLDEIRRRYSWSEHVLLRATWVGNGIRGAGATDARRVD
jgi:SAM-dependent methyltransferase